MKNWNTYNTSAEDIHRSAREIDEALNRSVGIEERLETVIWVAEELFKMNYYLAKRIDDLQVFINEEQNGKKI